MQRQLSNAASVTRQSHGWSVEIVCNGQIEDLETGATIADLLGRMRLSGPVAVEVNEQLARREQHGQWVLSEGDRVEVVTLVGGG